MSPERPTVRGIGQAADFVLDAADPGEVGEPGEVAVPVEVEEPPEVPRAATRTPPDQRLGAVIPILLAALGLAAAIIAWRAGSAGDIADDANRAGLDAARNRAASEVINEGLTARANEAYLDYERSPRRADALAAAGLYDEALLNRMQATSHWFLVRPEYIDRNGQYQPNQERAALLADDEQTSDLQPLAHFDLADEAYGSLRGMAGAGIVVALALPFLTVAQVGRGRLRLAGILGGTVIFGAGIVLAAMAWA